MVSPVPTGPIFNVAGKIGAWLVNAREEDAETANIVRHSLRTSLCRYDPYAPGVDDLAGRIEARMWELAKTPAKRAGFFEGWGTRLRGKLPKFRKHVKQDALDFPQWRSELKAWVREAAAKTDFPETALRCRSRPASADDLAERFPALFYLEVVAPSRMNLFRVRLLERLKAADDRKASFTRAFGDTQLWLTGGYGAGAAAVGLTVAQVAEWSDPGVAAGVGGMAGVIFGLIQRQRHEQFTAEQQRARARVRQWIYVYLRTRTEADDDEHQLLVLQQAIEEESSRRHDAGVPTHMVAAKHRRTISEHMENLRQKLRWELVPEADAAQDAHIVAALRSLDSALENADQEACESEEVVACLHRLMVALELAPPVSERERDSLADHPGAAGETTSLESSVSS